MTNGKPSYKFPSLVAGKKTFLYSFDAVGGGLWMLNDVLGEGSSYERAQSDADCPAGLAFNNLKVECID